MKKAKLIERICALREQVKELEGFINDDAPNCRVVLIGNGISDLAPKYLHLDGENLMYGNDKVLIITAGVMRWLTDDLGSFCLDWITRHFDKREVFVNVLGQEIRVEKSMFQEEGK